MRNRLILKGFLMAMVAAGAVTYSYALGDEPQTTGAEGNAIYKEKCDKLIRQAAQARQRIKDEVKSENYWMSWSNLIRSILGLPQEQEYDIEQETLYRFEKWLSLNIKNKVLPINSTCSPY